MTTRSAPAIVYPEADGMPLPDGKYQAPIYRRIVRDHEDHFKDVAGVNVNGDTFIYYVEGNPRRSFSSDCYVVFGLTEAAEARAGTAQARVVELEEELRRLRGE